MARVLLTTDSRLLVEPVEHELAITEVPDALLERWARIRAEMLEVQRELSVYEEQDFAERQRR